MANSTKAGNISVSPPTDNKTQKAKEQLPASKTTKNQEPIESISLTTKNNQSITLTSEALEQWFAKLEATERRHNQKDKQALDPHAPEVNPSYLSTIYVGRYGLKSAKDVITFLKSPAGHSVQAMIIEQLEEIASIQAAIRQQQLDHEVRRHRALAALLLGLIYEKEAQAKERNALLQEDIDKRLHQQNSTTTSETDSSIATKHQEAHAAFAAYTAYTASIAALEHVLGRKIKESEDIEQQMEKLAEQKAVIETRYQQFEAHITELDHFGILLHAHEMSPEQRAQHISELRTALEATSTLQAISEDARAEADTLQSVLSLLEQANAPTTTKFLENKVKTLEKTLRDQAAEISRLLEADKDIDAMKLLHEHNALHVQFEGLRDMIAVIKVEKILWDMHGRPTNSLKDAMFVLPKEKSIVYSNGQYYLLQPGQDFDSMSQEEKATAQKSYERARPDISNVKTLVHHNKAIEEREHQEKQLKLSVRSETMQQEILLVTNQLTQLQAAQADAATLMKQLSADMYVPTPKPTPNKNATAPSNAVTQSYRHMLLLMKANPTEESVQRLKKVFTKEDGKIETAIERILKNITLGRPIPESTMQALLKNLNRLAVSANKPNVTPVKDPSELTAPSPFATKPKLTPY